MTSCVLRLLLIWLPKEAVSISRKVGEKLRLPALHAPILHCAKKSTRMAPPKTLTDSNTVFAKSPIVPQFFDPDNQIQTIHYFFTEVYRLNTLVGSVGYLLTLLKYTLFLYNEELYPTFLHCWAIPNPKTILRYTQLYYIAERNRNSLHCRAVPNPNTFLRHTQS